MKNLICSPKGADTKKRILTGAFKDFKWRPQVAATLAALMFLTAAPMAFADYGSGYQFNQNPYGYPADVTNTEYFAPVKFLKDRKIVQGNEQGLFMPEKGLTRAELAVMVAKATGNDQNQLWDKQMKYFDDLKGCDWAMPYINACKRLNILRGKSERMFDPGAQVSYVEYMAVIARMQNPYIQVAGQWPENYINYSNTVLTNLISDRKITNWQAPATRGDVAMIMYRILPKN